MFYMWSIKFLSGPKAGKEIVLQPGLLLLGREASCQIQILSEGISKKHAQIYVKNDSVFIEDIGSSNGTFIRGKKIFKQKLTEGDRVALYNVVFEVKKRSDISYFPGQGMIYNQQVSPHLMNQKPEGAEGGKKPLLDTKQSLYENIRKLVQVYIEDVILPGVYKLAEWIEFRWVVGFFVIGFIVFVTTFSSIPLLSILKSSVEQESRNNADSIASTLSLINREPIQKGLQTAVSVDYALRRRGVEKAFIISALDGRILAPAEIAHSYPKQPLIHKARKKNEKTIEKLGSSSILAVNPISFFNVETGESLPKAYSVVIYDKGSSLLISHGKVASLLIQNLLIASLIGLLLYFFLIKLIEFPIQSINRQFSKALKDDKAPSIFVRYESQILQDLCGHVNSALNQISLNRLLNSKKEEEESGEINRQNEMSNLVEIVGFPAIGINMEDKSIASLNSNFSDQLGFSEILHQNVSEVSNGQLRDHLLFLLEQGQSNPEEIAFGEIELSQMKLQSTCQFVMGKKTPAYAIITFMSSESEEVA